MVEYAGVEHADFRDNAKKIFKSKKSVNTNYRRKLKLPVHVMLVYENGARLGLKQ